MQVQQPLSRTRKAATAAALIGALGLGGSAAATAIGGQQASKTMLSMPAAAGPGNAAPRAPIERRARG